MARPRRSTIDEFIDQYDSFDIETQERVMDQLQLVHRLAKRWAGKKPEPDAPVVDIDTLLDQRSAVLNGGVENAGREIFSNRGKQ